MSITLTADHSRILALPKKGTAVPYLENFKEGDVIKLKGNYTWQVGALKDTISKEEKEQWEECYLPEHMKMKVLGRVKHISWDSPIVLLMCEDGKIYAYDAKQLHLVAESMKQLTNEGVTFPSEKVYHYGQAFEDMTEEELAEVSQSKERAKATEMHRKEAERWGDRILQAFSEVQEYYNIPPNNTEDQYTGHGGKKKKISADDIRSITKT